MKRGDSSELPLSGVTITITVLKVPNVVGRLI
jgi:hypothetical protein